MTAEHRASPEPTAAPPGAAPQSPVQGPQSAVPGPEKETSASGSKTLDSGPGTLDRGPGTLDPATAAELDGLRKKATERDEFLALAQRVQADFANYQKRIGREREDDHKYLIAGLLRDLLPAVDALDACATMAGRGGDPKSHVEGFLIAQKELARLLEKNGLKAIAPAEGTFNPAVHEAVGFVDRPDREENSVGELMRKGWQLHDRVLRPAQIRLARRPSPPPEAAAPAG